MGFMPKTEKEAESLIIMLTYLIAIIVSIVYFVLPVDVIPDVAVGVGQIDDVGVGVIAFTIATLIVQALNPQAGRRGNK